MTQNHKLVLASSSPRRQEMLKGLGLTFTIDPADVDETPHKGEAPRDYVRRVAIDKVRTVAARQGGALVLGADTTVAVGRRILGKAESAEEAADMLRLMAGRRHRVFTTVVLALSDGTIREKTTNTVVKIRPLTEAMIAAYVAQPAAWRGVAGAYGLQTAIGGALVAEINGSASGVIGMPLVETVNLLRSAGLDV
ncbi:MAG: septum formation protein Maf [Proteobacteria bacterium]|nr:septum formation protein Maf [Pseudomonadota bacterium]